MKMEQSRTKIFSDFHKLQLKKKSQYSMEFMIFFALISIIFSVWLVIYMELNQDVFLERDQRAVEDIGKSIQAQLFIAAEAHPGFFSKNLIIPEKAGYISFEINNTPYILQIRTPRTGDFVFNIPFTNGTLKKGQNTIWNICGVVFLSDYPPVSDLSCTYFYFTNCTDGIDNDHDGLIDGIDGGCWYNYTNPYFNWAAENEQPDTNIPPVPPEVYNYYVPCRNANDTGMCSQISVTKPWGPYLNYTAEDCCQFTSENLCPSYCP